MRAMRLIGRVLGVLLVAAPAMAQQGPTLEDVLARINQTEGALITNMRNFKPMIEVYLQNLKADDQLGFVPAEDAYVLGRFDWKNGPRLQTLTGGKEAPRFEGARRNQNLEYVPDGFAAMAAPDWEAFSTQKYEFTLVRREFVGEARCYVLDVKPRRNMDDGFAGRIWVEDRGYNIVRFNGINRRIERIFFRKQVSFHVDSWRTNVRPDLWLPSYVYVEETDPRDVEPNATAAPKPKFKSHIRLWGYDTQAEQKGAQFTAISIDSLVNDPSEKEKQLSPVESQRRWEQEAEENVLARLEKARLLAKPGDVEQVLETVINNLLVTNDITLDRAIKARVLLTSPLESFTVGHTIVMSRGLIDVLPDEASLAMMLAHELGHIVLRHPLVNSQFAFADRMMITDEQLLKTLKVRRPAQEETDADAKVIEMLKKSPYGDKLAEAGLFLRIVSERAKLLPNLIQPHLGDHMADGGQMQRLNELMQKSPELAPQSLKQIAALSLGARLIVDPWTSRLELLRTASQPVSSVREKVPLAVTPLTPFTRYVDAPSAAPAGDAGAAAPARAQSAQ